jgi:hydroxymethylglutaryl-CoA lyase
MILARIGVYFVILMKLIECPRDAMQGLHDFVPTEEKIRYINQLLKVGFDTIDFGSFVSEKAVPQMRDTAELLAGLDLADTKSKLLAIVANLKGAQNAVIHPEINYLGYPFSVSETFQLRNTNKTIAESFSLVSDINELCEKTEKQLVVYISMGFGNPYGDPWDPQLVVDWCGKLSEECGVKIMALSDTVGVSTPANIVPLFETLIPSLPSVEFGAHLHTTPDFWREKVEAAMSSGCNRFDGALRGFGGCPMAADTLTGNMPTEHVVAFIEERGIEHGLNLTAFEESLEIAGQLFGKYS